jgi:hypothetical protein
MDDLRETIGRIDRIRSEIATLRTDRETARRLHADTMTSLDQREKEIQFNCSHELKSTVSDYAGNWDQCEICGADLGRSTI